MKKIITTLFLTLICYSTSDIILCNNVAQIEQQANAIKNFFDKNKATLEKYNEPSEKLNEINENLDHVNCQNCSCKKKLEEILQETKTIKDELKQTSQEITKKLRETENRIYLSQSLSSIGSALGSLTGNLLASIFIRPTR